MSESSPSRFCMSVVVPSNSMLVRPATGRAILPLEGSWYGFGFPYLSVSKRGVNSAPVSATSQVYPSLPLALIVTNEPVKAVRIPLR